MPEEWEVKLNMAAQQGKTAKDRFLEDQFEKVLTDLGQELLPEDRVVAEAFLKTSRHIGIEELVQLAQAWQSSIDETYVRRTMRLLCDLGIAQPVRLDDKVVYEHLHLDQHHDHMICVRCGRIWEFANPVIEDEQLNACDRAGFRPLMHKLEIRGICSECAEKLPSTRSLATCLPGEEVVVAQILGGRAMSHRLMAMGLAPGTPIRVLTSDGPVTVEIRGSRLALGRGQACRIMVQQRNEVGP